MILSRWKVMAGLLGLSVGGLATCADPAPNQLQPPVTARPTRPATAPETTLPAPINVPGTPKPAPEIAAQSPTPPTVREFEIQLPPINTTPTPVPDGGTVVIGGLKPIDDSIQSPLWEKLLAGPMAMQVLAAQAQRPMIGEIVPPMALTQTVAQGVPTPPQPLYPPPLVQAPMATAPMIPTPNQTPPRPPIADQAPPLPPLTPRTVPTPIASTGDKVKMLMRLGSGTPRFEIRSPDGEELLLKVYCDKIEMKAPTEQARGSQIAGVTATGKVRFTGPGIEGACDQLSILSGTGEVLMQGNITMKTKRGKAWSEMAAEKMIYQIGAQGLASPTTTRTGVTPVDYRE